jgi:cytochrome c556
MARSVMALLAVGTLQACTIPADPRAVVSERQADMRELDLALSAVRDGLEAPAADLTTIGARAARMRAIADKLDSQFRIPDREVASGTNPDAWARPGEFAGEVGRFRRASESLLASARAGNREGAVAAASEVESRCASCHAAFRAPKPDR